MATKEGVGAYPLNSNFVYRQTVLPLSYNVGASSYNKTSQDFAALLRDWTFVDDPITHQGTCSFDCESISTQNGQSVAPSATIGFVLNSVIKSVLSTNRTGSTVFPCEAGVKPTTKTVTRADLTTSTANTTSYTSNSFTPNRDDWLIVFVLGGNTDGDTISVTDTQGIGFTELISDGLGASHGIHVFTANGVASPTAMTVTFNCDGGTGAAIYVARVGGSNRNIVQSFSTTIPTGNSINMPYNMNPDNLIFAVAGTEVNPANVEPPTKFTELEGTDTGFNTPNIGMAVSYSIEGNNGDSVITWNTPTFYTQMALEIGTIDADATTRFGSSMLVGEGTVTGRAGLTYRDIVSLTEEAVIGGQAGALTSAGRASFVDDSVLSSRGNIVINNYEYFNSDSIVVSLGGMTLNSSQVFTDESVINSFAGITINNTNQFDEESNIGVIGNIVFNRIASFDEEGITRNTGNIQFNNLCSFDEEGIVTNTGNISINGNYQLDQEAIIYSNASIIIYSQVNGNTAFDLEGIITSNAALNFNSSPIFGQEGVILNTGSLTINHANQRFDEEAVLNSVSAITMNGVTQFAEEGSTGVRGNIQFNSSKSFDEEGVITTFASMTFGTSLSFDEEVIITGAGSVVGTSEVFGTAGYDLESIITSTGSIQFSSGLTFSQETVIANTGSFTFAGRTSFDIEGNTGPTGNISFGPSLNAITGEVQVGSSANTIFGPYQSYLTEIKTGVTGNISMTGAQSFECEIQIFPSGITTAISIVSGAVIIHLEGQAAQTGNITLGQAISFNNEVILTNIYSVDIGSSIIFPIESITDISSTALIGGVVVFPNEVQLTATNESVLSGTVVILLEAQLTADGLRQMVSNRFDVSVNMARAFHVELTIPDLEITLNHQSPIEVDLTINRTFPVILTINMGRSI